MMDERDQSMDPDDALELDLARLEEQMRGRVQSALDCDPPPTAPGRIAAIADRLWALAPANSLGNDLVRREIRDRLGILDRTYWDDKRGSFFPGTDTIVDDLFEGLPWFASLDASGKSLAYRIAVDEIDRMKLASLKQTALANADPSTKASAGRQAERVEQLRRVGDRLAELDPRLGEVYDLAERAGRSAATVATLLNVSLREAERDIAMARVEMELLVNQGA